MINYNKINKNINELLKEDNYIFQMKEFTDKMSKDYLNLLEKKSSILDLEEEYNDKISYRMILKNACGFIKDFNNKYYDILKTIYKKGFIKPKFNKKANPYSTLKHGHVYINWQVLYNMDSSFILVHEFSHALNVDEEISDARQYLTEGIAYLFEFLLLDYLEQKKYNNSDMYKSKLLNFVHTYDSALSLYNNNDFFDIIEKNQRIDKNIIKDYYEEKEENEFLKWKCKTYEEYIPFFENKKYLLGIIVASDIHMRLIENPELKKQIIYLIDNINDMRFEDCFEFLNIKLVKKNGKIFIDDSDYERLMKNLRLELENTYEKYKGVQNEESNSNCRTNRCRKN